MNKYLDLLKTIKEEGVYKPPARAGMPGTYSIFGYQNSYDLSEGFPLLTTKRLSFKNIVVELLWFLKGDTNIKYLVDNGCNIWNEDSYNYYLKIYKKTHGDIIDVMPFETFVEVIKSLPKYKLSDWNGFKGYTLGDCGKQYGWLWRKWKSVAWKEEDRQIKDSVHNTHDQIKDLIDGLKNNPMGRRHILTAWNPATLDDMALNACHAFVQFNCRPLTLSERTHWWFHNQKPNRDVVDCFNDRFGGESAMKELDIYNIPRYYIDCQMYQRSADVFLGVPYNIASYALLTEILAKICNMIPGKFIHTFGDVHIYEDHVDAVNEQLSRIPSKLPNVNIKLHMKNFNVEQFQHWLPEDFEILDYNPQSSIKAKLSTGLK